MLRGGCAALGESRMENVARLRAAGVETSVMLLRVPPLSAVDEVVTGVDVSLNSELAVEGAFRLRLRWLSGGNSSALPLIASGRMPARVNHLRIGEAILLGRETIHRTPWPGTAQDAFLLRAEVIEEKIKPSVPIGERGQDAFGQRPAFPERGEVERALVNVGREDVVVEGLVPLDPRLTILGASSDYLIVDVSAAAGAVRVGDELVFAPNYAALLALMTSPYVDKRVVGEA
jgi:predicted amino acid racemase